MLCDTAEGPGRSLPIRIEPLSFCISPSSRGNAEVDYLLLPAAGCGNAGGDEINRNQ